jgi:tetratricopeptide (TPR) repeat protein
MDSGAALRLAEAYRQEGLLEDALRILRDALLCEPGAIDVRLHLARLLAEQGSFDAALAEADRIGAMAPNGLEALELKAQVLALRRGRGRAAVSGESGSPNIPSGPPDGLASPTLAKLYSAQGYADRAKKLEAELSGVTGGSRSASRPAILDRLAAFRDAARRRREEVRP